MMKVVIVGAGEAGYTTANTLREHAPEAEISIFDPETLGLYARLRLVEYVAGALPEEKLILADADAFRKLDIQPVFGVEATEILRAEHRVRTGDGRLFDYDKLVLATGADARVPPIAGLDLVTSYTLRTLDDARKIVAAAEQVNGSALVVGGGLLGLEAAAALRRRGMRVTVAECRRRLLPRQLKLRQSAALQEKLAALELNVKLNASLARVEPADGGRIHASFADGSTEICSLLLFSAGIQPRTGLARQAELAVGNAISVDHSLRTSDPDIYAVGDCAEIDGKTPGLWTAAKNQGAALGEILAGGRESFDPPEYSPCLKIAGIRVRDLCPDTARGGP